MRESVRGVKRVIGEYRLGLDSDNDVEIKFIGRTELGEDPLDGLASFVVMMKERFKRKAEAAAAERKREAILDHITYHATPPTSEEVGD